MGSDLQGANRGSAIEICVKIIRTHSFKNCLNVAINILPFCDKEIISPSKQQEMIKY